MRKHRTCLWKYSINWTIFFFFFLMWEVIIFYFYTVEKFPCKEFQWTSVSPCSKIQKMWAEISGRNLQSFRCRFTWGEPRWCKGLPSSLAQPERGKRELSMKSKQLSPWCKVCVLQLWNCSYMRQKGEWNKWGGELFEPDSHGNWEEAVRSRGEGNLKSRETALIQEEWCCEAS